MFKRIPDPDPQLIEAIGKLIGEERAARSTLTDIVRATITASLEPDAEARRKALTYALADLDAGSPATPQQTAQLGTLLRRAMEIGYHADSQ